MNEKAINKDIQEKIMGKCWHESVHGNICDKCGAEYKFDWNPSYTRNPVDYWKFINKCFHCTMWWPDFTRKVAEDSYFSPQDAIVHILLDMPRACRVILEFLQQNTYINRYVEGNKICDQVDRKLDLLNKLHEIDEE